MVATVTETRGAAGRGGLEAVDRRLQIGNAEAHYHQVVNPREGDRPVAQGYGDYLFGLEFPAGASWNWDLEYFLDVSVSRPGAAAFVANRATLQAGTHVLERGKRAVADLVWPMPAAKAGTTRPDTAAVLALRMVKVAADPAWLYLEVRLDGDPRAAIAQVRTRAYPFITTGPPERRRWLTTLTKDYGLTDAAQKFDPAAEWALVLHNRRVQAERGCLLVFDPSEVRSATAGGTYCVQVNLTPKVERRVVHLALGYFRDERYETAVTHLRAEAPAVLERLRQTRWTADLHPPRRGNASGGQSSRSSWRRR